MANSSASPEHLQTFVTQGGQANQDLADAIAHANGPVQAFLDAPCDPRFRPAGLGNAMSQAQQYHQDNATDQRWIAGIRQAFIDADSSTLPDAAIARSLANQGIAASAPPAMTVDEPVYHPATMYSGWSDDPVSTAAGAFWHSEEDLVMPPALSVLAWPRTYNSRSRAHGPHGTGWSSWATVRLDVTDLAVTFHGPDGQVADFLASPGGFETPLGVPAVLTRHADGYDLAWRWTAQYPGARWSFDREGRLTAADNPAAGRTAFERDDVGRLITARHEGGRHVTLAWDGERVVGLSSSDGRRVRYEWDGDGLVGVQRPGGGMRYELDEDRRVAALEDADGVVLARNRYDEEGRVVQQVSPFGRVTRYRYLLPHTVLVEGDSAEPATLFRHDGQGHLVELQVAGELRWSRQFDGRGNPVRVVSPDGTVTSRRFDTDGNCVGQRQSGVEGGGLEWAWAYDREGRVTAATAPSGVTLTFTYDGDGPQPSVVEGPLGMRAELVSERGVVRKTTDPDGVTVTYEHNPDRQVTAITDGLGQTTRFTYHPSGQLATVEYPTGEVQRWEHDEAGRAIVSIAPGGGRATRRYSPAGRLLDETSPEGGRASWTMGAHGQPVALTGPAGAQLSLEWDQRGFIESVSGPTGATWRYGWDEAGRLARFTDGNGATWAQLWARDGHYAGYTDPLGREQRFVTDANALPVSVTSAAGRRYDLRWDDAGRLVGGTTPEGPSSCEIRYDPLGRPAEWVVDGVSRSRAVYTPAGRLSTLARLDGSAWQFGYDGAGRLVSCEGPEGVERWGRDAAGRVIRHQAPDGSVTEWRYGPDGQVAEVRSGGAVRRLRHDRDGRIVEEELTGWGPRRLERGPGGAIMAVHDASGGVTRFERDWRGAVVAWVDANGARWTAESDGQARPLAVTDPLGRRSAWELDPTGQAVALSLPDGTRRAYRRDADGGLLSLAAVDQSGVTTTLLDVSPDREARAVTLRDPQAGAVRLRWDGLGRVVEFDTREGTTRWEYDDANRRVTIAGPDGTVRAEIRGPTGAVETLEHPRLGKVTVERDPAGRPLALRAAGLLRQWERDNAGRVTSYREEIAGEVRHTVIERDDAGRAVRVVEDGAAWTYAYDQSGQLVGADGPAGAWAWEYDVCGRLLTEDGPGGSRRFHYDAADQLSAIDGPDGTTVVSYDPLGRRVSEEGPGLRVRYHWDSQDRLAAVERSAGGQTRRTELVYDALGRPVRVGDHQVRWELGGPLGPRPAGLGEAELVELPGLPVATIGSDGARWLSADWRGNLAARSPWGAPLASGEAPGLALGFLGEIEIEGLVWLRSRVYDPATHTFLTRDPLAGLAGGPGTATNPYLYAANDPLQMVDPLGRKPITAEQANQQMQAWKQGHWKEVLVTTLAVAGTVALIAATGGAAAVVAGAVIGGGAMGGGTVLADVIHHQPIDWTQVVMNTAIGGFAGAVAGPMTDVLVPADASTSTAIGANALIGGTSNAGTTALGNWASNQPITAEGELISFGTGAGGGALGRSVHLSTDFQPERTDYTWRDFSGLSDKQKYWADSTNPIRNVYAPEKQAATAFANSMNRWNTEINELGESVKQQHETINMINGHVAGGLGTVGGDVLTPVSGPATPATPATLRPQLPYPTMPTPSPTH